MAKHETSITSEQRFNRTGIMANPELSAELITTTEQSRPSPQGDLSASSEMRASYVREGLPIGSPPHLGEDGGNAAGLQGMAVLLDKLGERLAFERQGTRLYQAVIQKCEAVENGAGLDLSLDDLQRICDEELQHFKMLQNAIIELGGDATIQTPSADIIGVISKGAVEVACDPRTTLPQTLQALLTAELADNDGWQLLQDLAVAAGQDELEKRCREAYEQEQEHLEKVRDWITAATLSQVSESGAEMDQQESRRERRKPARKTASRGGAARTSKARKSGAKSSKRKKKR